MIMLFDIHKKNFLNKKDKSCKGSIDNPIKKFIGLLNNSYDYYSTSSCSGRTLLIIRKKGKKYESKWIYANHTTPKSKDIREVILRFLDGKIMDSVYFRFEPAIFHICCRSLKDAQTLVNISRGIGFRRTGIQSTKRKILVEISSSEFIDAIIIRKRKLLVPFDYITELAMEASLKQKENKNKIKRLEDSLPFH